MKSLLIACLIGFTLAAPNTKNERRCWSSGNGLGAQWWDEGSRVDRGRFWYECRNGDLEPMGCFSDTKERLYIFGTFVKNGYEMKCVMGSDNYLQFDYTACVPDGVTRYEPGQTWEDSRRMYFYECKRNGEFLRSEIAGCVTHDKSRRVKINEKYDDGEFIYQCLIKETGAAQMCSVGCMHNGVRYEIGQSWPDGDYVYYCKSENGRCKKECIGCQFNNQRLQDGDRYTKEKTVYQCQIRPDSQKHNPVACAVNDDHNDKVERVIGCRWFSQSADSKVELTCERDGEDKTAVKTLGCIYVKNGFDTLFVTPNKYTLWTQSMDEPAKAVACKEVGDGQYRLEIFPPEEIAQRAFGLQYERPQGK